MKFNFIEKKLKLDPEIISYAEKKVGKLDKFFRAESEANVVFSIERGRCRVEVTLNNNGMYYRATEVTNEMHASIDSACAAIERQIRKNKPRLEKRLREGSLSESSREYVALGDSIDSEAPESEEFKIIRTKRFSIKPMSPEEAILQMNLLEHEFFAFLNQDDEDSFSVVYRRKQGGYGLISASDAHS